MEHYRVIYPFEVFGKIAEGKTVCVLDRKMHSCDVVNELPVEEAAKAINCNQSNRYEFWIEEKTEEIEE